MTAAAEAEAEARWREHPLDAIALIRASINYDSEGEETITRYADTDHVIDWLTVLARSWLFNACGLHNGVPLDQVVECAHDYLATLSDIYSEAA